MDMSSSYIGPASMLVTGSYACEVRPCGTEVFCDGKIMVEVPKSGVSVMNSPDTTLAPDSQPFAELVTKGTYTVYLDPEICMEVFEGGYVDEEHRRMSLRCRVGAVYVVPASSRRTDGAVELGNGSGIIHHI